jgi:hypothetical protein
MNIPESEQLCVSLASPPDREYLVAMINVGAEQWAELNQENGLLTLEVYPRRDGQPWMISYEAAMTALRNAKERLVGDSAA